MTTALLSFFVAAFLFALVRTWSRRRGLLPGASGSPRGFLGVGPRERYFRGRDGYQVYGLGQRAGPNIQT